MYFHQEVRGHKLPLDVSAQQACHVTIAKTILETQINRKVRKGKVKYV